MTSPRCAVSPGGPIASSPYVDEAEPVAASDPGRADGPSTATASTPTEGAARVAGRITVDGGVPAEPISIALITPGAAPRHAFTENGRFGFLDLPADWSGALQLARELELDPERGPKSPDEENQPLADREFFAWVKRANSSYHSPELTEWSIPLDHPDPMIEIPLVSATGIRGRLQREGPVPGGGYVQPFFGERSSPGSVNFKASSSGSFCVRIPPAAERLNLTVWDETGLGAREIALDGPFRGIKDIGDVELGPLHSLPFHVVDDAGKPVQGARAVIGGTSTKSDPTDAEGRSSIRVDDAVSSIVVGKVEYAAATVPVDPGNRDPLEVRLHPGRWLSIDARLADGSLPTSGIYVNLSAQSDLFEDVEYADWVYCCTGGSTPIDDAHLAPDDTNGVGYKPDAAGRVVVPGLRAGTLISLQLRTRGFDTLLGESFIVMADAGEMKVRLSGCVDVRTVEGVVRTSEGDPVAGAEVSFTEEGSDFAGLTIDTDREGRFGIANLTTATVRIQVTKPGFAELEVPSVRVPLTGALQTLTLKR